MWREGGREIRLPSERELIVMGSTAHIYVLQLYLGPPPTWARSAAFLEADRSNRRWCAAVRGGAAAAGAVPMASVHPIGAQNDAEAGPSSAPIGPPAASNSIIDGYEEDDEVRAARLKRQRRALVNVAVTSTLFYGFGIAYYTQQAKKIVQFWPNGSALDPPRLEQWDVVDAIYFATVTMTTTGYGDLKPLTVENRAVTLVYMFFGFLVRASPSSPHASPAAVAGTACTSAALRTAGPLASPRASRASRAWRRSWAAAAERCVCAHPARPSLTPRCCHPPPPAQIAFPSIATAMAPFYARLELCLYQVSAPACIPIPVPICLYPYHVYEPLCLYPSACIRCLRLCCDACWGIAARPTWSTSTAMASQIMRSLPRLGSGLGSGSGSGLGLGSGLGSGSGSGLGLGLGLELGLGPRASGLGPRRLRGASQG